MNEPEKKQTHKTLVERREFLGGAATLAGASIIGGRSNGPQWLGLPAEPTSAPRVAPPVISPAVEHRTKRWQEQRWLLDAVIQVIGPEWDEGRLNGQAVELCGPDVLNDVDGVRSRVRRFNDLTRELARVAVRREKMAQQYEERGYTVADRENYFMAAIFYMYALWPIFETTRELIALNERKASATGNIFNLRIMRSDAWKFHLATAGSRFRAMFISRQIARDLCLACGTLLE